MSVMIILIIILGTAVGVFTVFIIKAFIAPRVIGAMAEALKRGKSQQVIRQAKQLIARDSRNVDAHYFLGQAYLAEERPELALMEFKLINKIGQFSQFCSEVPFRKQAAGLFRKFNQDEEALKEYLLLIRKEPMVAEYYFNAGEVFEERRMLDKTYQYYLKTVELDKLHTGAHLRLGVLLYKQKKPLEAKSEFEIVLKNEPENYEAHFYLGRLQKEMHDYAGALRSFEKAQRDPDFKVKALIETGTCYMNTNNLEKAIPPLERAVALTDSNHSSEMLFGRYFLSLCYERTRELDKAIEHWEFIYAKKPSFKDVAQKLSQYQDLRSDDRMKDFMTSNSEDFLMICKAILQALKLESRDVIEIKDGCQISALEAEQNWRSSRRMPRLLMFLRVTEPVDESTIRGLQEKMKKNNIIRGIVLTSSTFTRKAIEYAETRPIDLMNKEKLSAILKKINF